MTAHTLLHMTFAEKRLIRGEEFNDFATAPRWAAARRRTAGGAAGEVMKIKRL
jgi:hypothetical protein